MLNILKSDLYRLFRSRAFYICTFIATLIFVAGAFLSKWANELSAKSQNLDTIPELPFKSGIYYGIGAFTDGSLRLYLAVFIAIFITAEFVYGTMKNAVSKGYSKIQIYLSKLITMTIASYIMLLIMFVFGVLAGTIVTGNFGEATENLTMEALRAVGIELLLYMALTSIFVMIAMIVRNNGGTIAVNVIGVVTFGSFIYQILDMLFDSNTSFSYYGLQNNIALFYNNLDRPGDEMIRAICVGLVFLIVTVAIGMAAFKNSDVK